MPESLAIGVDIGGTKIVGLLVDIEAGRILGRRLVETPADDEEATTRAVVAVARELSASRDVRALGVASAGLVDRNGVLRYAPNLAWRDFPLRERVGADVGLPTMVDNDANAAAWGEFRFGAGRGCSDMLLVTVGTGIGGGIVIDGKLFRGAHGFAAEIGHIIVEPGGPRCGCGNLGCWEQVASGKAIGRLGREAVAEHPDSELAKLAREHPQEVTGVEVTKAAQQGDPIAVQILAKVGRRLGEGIAGLVNVLDPEMVVVGGGAIEAGELLLRPARDAFVATVEAPEHRPEVPIVAAALANDAGAVGVADLACLEVAET